MATGWWSRPTNSTAPSSGCRARSASSPTSTPSISTIFGTRRGDGGGVRRVLPAGAVLRRHRHLHRPSGGAADDRRPHRGDGEPHASPTASRTMPTCGWSNSGPRGRRRCSTSSSTTGVAGRRGGLPGVPMPVPGDHNALNATAAFAVAARAGLAGRRDHRRDRDLLRRQAPLHPDRHVERRRLLRRLCPPSGRTRGGAEGGASKATKGRVIGIFQPHRYTRITGLYQGLLRLLRRCRHGHRDAGLFGGRGAGRRRRPEVDRRRHRRDRPPRRPPCRQRARAGAADRRASPGPAISSSASAPAPSPTGPMACRNGWRKGRSASGRRGERRRRRALSVRQPDEWKYGLSVFGQIPAVAVKPAAQSPLPLEGEG